MAAPNARIVGGSGRSILGEGCLWPAAAGAIYWVDIPGQRLRRLTLATGSIEAWDMPRPIGWMIERRDAPGLIAGFDTGFAAMTLDPIASSRSTIPSRICRPTG